ncbi:fluoride efflux transporter CrcB [Reinekea thalattae]|uniref:Fluoride-specific ion channel FluC n=1 Tax=Reinekea thalattae TaxID=2593301 RepID=A0A5C8Z838_9GAMM|nr:fluoride efflux transporter CrcB [Reinekea thalattae]TXR53463.1 fluoride efflux transporter CrcB [Reinekea thalattae]
MAALSIWHWAVIGLGGGLGAMARFATVNFINRLHGSQFPLGTLSVNVVGSFIMGVAFVFFTIKFQQLPSGYKSFVMVGLLGAFTTFSSFALETLSLIQQHYFTIALLYIAASITACLVAVLAGYVLGKFIF